MIVVKLMGGLGNQMFQYAAGKSLSLRLGTELKMDRSFLDGPQTGNTPRGYELGAFCVREEFADSREVAELTGREASRWRTVILRLRQGAGFSRYRPNILREKDFRFQPEFLTVSGDMYMEGYWQSEKYFSEVSDVIRNEFSTRRSLKGRDRELADAVEGDESVSVHIRRGDYAPRPGPTDLELMSRCRYHVLANSSFSWWGAWLGTWPGKFVLAPVRWFSAPDVDTTDLLPASWELV